MLYAVKGVLADVSSVSPPLALRLCSDNPPKFSDTISRNISILIFIHSEVVLSSGSYVSFAGVANILYYDKATDKVYNVDGGWNTVLNQDPSKIPDVHTKEENGASVLIPGFIAGVSDAAEQFAKFPLSTLFEPALYFAQNGFKIPYGMASSIAKYYNDVTLLRTPEGKSEVLLKKSVICTVLKSFKDSYQTMVIPFIHCGDSLNALWYSLYSPNALGRFP